MSIYSLCPDCGNLFENECDCYARVKSCCICDRPINWLPRAEEDQEDERCQECIDRVEKVSSNSIVYGRPELWEFEAEWNGYKPSAKKAYDNYYE